MTTRKYIKKELKKELLIKKGYKAFNTHGCTADQLYAVIVILCNKINPDQPDRAFRTATELERNLSHGCSIRINAWNNVPAPLQVNKDSDTDGDDQLDSETSCQGGES